MGVIYSMFKNFKLPISIESYEKVFSAVQVAATAATVQRNKFIILQISSHTAGFNSSENVKLKKRGKDFNFAQNHIFHIFGWHYRNRKCMIL